MVPFFPPILNTLFQRDMLAPKLGEGSGEAVGVERYGSELAVTADAG